MKNLFFFLILLLFFACSEDLSENSIENNLKSSCSPCPDVSYRTDYPSQLAGDTILITYPSSSTFRTPQINALKGAIKRLGFVNLKFTLIPTDPYAAVIDIHEVNVNSMCGGSAINKVNGLFTRIHIDDNTLSQSHEWMRSFFMHEIAHCIGLGHPDQNLGSVNYTTMYDYSNTPGVMSPANCTNAANGTFTDVWDLGERNTLLALY